jgi:hypothetical protein
MKQFLRESATLAIAGATMAGLVLTNASADAQTWAFVIILTGAGAAGVTARIRRGARNRRIDAN